MVRDIQREDGLFTVDEFHYENLYFHLRFGGRVYGRCHIQIDGKVAYVHLYMDKFSKRILKEMIADFKLIKLRLKGKGITHIAGSKEADDCTCWLKFIRLMGFDKVADVIIGCKDAKLAIMEV